MDCSVQAISKALTFTPQTGCCITKRRNAANKVLVVSSFVFRSFIQLASCPEIFQAEVYNAHRYSIALRTPSWAMATGGGAWRLLCRRRSCCRCTEAPCTWWRIPCRLWPHPRPSSWKRSGTEAQPSRCLWLVVMVCAAALWFVSCRPQPVRAPPVWQHRGPRGAVGAACGL